MSHQYANRLMTGAPIAREIEPVGVISEYAVREIAKVEPSKRQDSAPHPSPSGRNIDGDHQRLAYLDSIMERHIELYKKVVDAIQDLRRIDPEKEDAILAKHGIELSE